MYTLITLLPIIPVYMCCFYHEPGRSGGKHSKGYSYLEV